MTTTLLFNQAMTPEDTAKNFNVKTKQGITNLFKQLVQDKKNNVINHWSEKQDPECSGLVLDFDIYQQHDAVQITQDDRFSIIKHCMEFLTSKFKSEDEFGIEYYICEITKPKRKDESDGMNKLLWDKRHNQFKDGIHYIIPNMCMSRKTKRWLLNALKDSKVINKVLGKYSIDNVDEVLDINTAHVPIMLLGSCKRTATQVYPITAYYTYDTDEKALKICDVDKVFKRANIITEFSINNWETEKVIQDKELRDLTDKASLEFAEWESKALERKEEAELKAKEFQPSGEDIQRITDNIEEFKAILDDVVMMLNTERATDSKQWHSVLSVLKSIGNTFGINNLELADKFSKQSDTAYVNTADVERVYNGIKPFGQFSLLMAWLKQDRSTSSSGIWSRYFKLCPPESKYKYYSDWEKLIYKDVKKKERREFSTYNEVLEWAQNSIFEVDTGGKHALYSRNRKYWETEKIFYDGFETASVINYINNLAKRIDIKKVKVVEGKTNETVIESTTVGTLLAHFVSENLLNRYSQVKFIPYTNDNKPFLPDALNTFTGFPIQSHKPKKLFDFKSSGIYKHIAEQLCAGDITDSNFVFNWLAHMIQKPAEVPGTALVFHSIQGGGKDMIGTFIRRLVGKNCSDVFSDPNHFFSKFNTSMGGLLFGVLNEIADKGIAYAQHNQLKAFIARDEVKIEPKGREQYTSSAFMRYAFFTNNENALNVENTDRRFAMFKSKNEFAQNETYFTPLFEEINNPDFIYSAFQYFNSLDISQFNIRKPPDNDYHLSQKVINLASSIRFIKHLYEDDYKFIDSDDTYNRPRKQDVLVREARLYELYRRWCEETVFETPVQMKTFLSVLSSFGLKAKKVRFDTGLKKGLILNKVQCEQLFKTFLKCERFMFNMNEEEEVEEEEEEAL